MKKLVVLTGAGISAESGISTFRDSICGTAKPKKPNGPQNAVTAPVSILTPVKTTTLISLMLTPMVVANDSPNSIKFNGLENIYSTKATDMQIGMSKTDSVNENPIVESANT